VSLWWGGCAGPGDNFWPTLGEDAGRFPGQLWRDAQAVVGSRENIALLLIGGGASGYVRCAHDDDIADHFADQHTFPRDFEIAQGAIGNPISHFAVAAGGYLWSVSREDEEGRGVWRSMLEALSLNGMVSITLKTIAQDHSPNGEALTWPSGHTSSSVTFATVLNEYYGPWVGLPLYALSGLVMYERMENGEHWASDVVMGAALGYVIGRSVARVNRPEIFGMDLVPYTSNLTGASGLALAKRF